MNVRRLFSITLLMAIMVMAVRPAIDPDMWWHLRTGQFIFKEGIPRQDIFSFTVADHRWIAHEWLSELFMWSIYRNLGFPGLILIFAGLAAAAFWLVFRRSAGRPYLAGFITLLAALATAPFWGVRPQLFNMLFAAFFIAILESHRRSAGRRRLLALPLLTILWANLHSGFMLGIALQLVYIVGGLADRLWPREGDHPVAWSQIKDVALITGMSLLAAALNPNGPELWIYPFFTLGSQAMQRYIQEWASPDFHQRIFWPFAGLLALGISGFIAGRRRPTWTDLLLFGGTAAAASLSARHIPIFAVTAVPIIAASWSARLEGGRLDSLVRPRSPLKSSTRFATANWLLLFLFGAAAALWSGQQIAANDEAVARNFPVAAVDFLEGSGLAQENGYNSYNWGGYLIWRDLPVFVDGRADVYGDPFLFYYRRAFDATSRWRDPLDDYDVSYVIMERGHSLSALLEASAEWAAAYSDNVATVMIRIDSS